MAKYSFIEEVFTNYGSIVIDIMIDDKNLNNDKELNKIISKCFTVEYKIIDDNSQYSDLEVEFTGIYSEIKYLLINWCNDDSFMDYYFKKI